MLCTLCPQLTTAKYFLFLLIAMFKGRSPRGSERPAGLSFHPFGNVTALGSSCAKQVTEQKIIVVIKIFFMRSIKGGETAI
jgi:hypothetical protein